MAAVFAAQALFATAWAIEQRAQLGPATVGLALGVAFVQALATAGLLRMRRWGQVLAAILAGVMMATAVWIRAAGGRAELVIPTMLTAGLILVYLVSSPARSQFT